MNTLRFSRFIKKEEERLYFPLPFEVPGNIERMTLRYIYPRFTETRSEGAVLSEETCIIDLGVNAPDGEFVGASGSDRTEIVLSPFASSHGYKSLSIKPGTWEIIVGAYKVPSAGVTVDYEIDMEEKSMRLFKGDLHMHTTGSDGVLTPEELGELCARRGLDFCFITNHNTFFENDYLPRRSDITVLPGTEWTHYKGHVNFLGVKKPYENPFCINDEKGTRAILLKARESGALLIVNHPFCAPECGWRWGMEITPFDGVEIWNGALMEGPNEKCLDWWHGQLCEGKRLPAVGGSDFHRETALGLPGLPCTFVYALSRAPEDIMDAIRAGRCFISSSPDGPECELLAGDAIMGDEAPKGAHVTAHFAHLRGGDLLRLITDGESKEFTCEAGTSERTLAFDPKDARFVRCEVLRAALPGLPRTRVLVSNPLYFSEEKRHGN